MEQVNFEPSAAAASTSGTPNSTSSIASSPTISLINELLDEISHFNESHPFDTPIRQLENSISESNVTHELSSSSSTSSLSASPNQSTSEESVSNTWSNTSSCLDASSTCTQLRVSPLEYTQETLQRKSKFSP